MTTAQKIDWNIFLEDMHKNPKPNFTQYQCFAQAHSAPLWVYEELQRTIEFKFGLQKLDLEQFLAK